MTSTKTIFVIEMSIRKRCGNQRRKPSLIQLPKPSRKKARRPHKFILDCCYGEGCTRRDLAFACRKRLKILFATIEAKPISSKSVKKAHQVLYAVPSELIRLDPLFTSLIPGCVWSML